MPYYVTFSHSGQPKLPPSLSVDRLSGLGRRRRPYRLRGLAQNEPSLVAATTWGAPAPAGEPSLVAATTFPNTPGAADATGASEAAGSALPYEGITSWLQNAFTGTLSTAQANAIAQNEQASLIQAGADPAAAAAQAQQDVSTVLTADQAAPSQAWSWASMSTLEKGLIIGGGALAALLLIRLVKR